MGDIFAQTGEVLQSQFDWSIDTTRNFLHLLGVIVWIGGQILVGAIMPMAKKFGPDAPQKIAIRFGKVAWPAYALAIITGLWSLGSEWSDSSSGWKLIIFVKLGVVALTGITAYMHMKAGENGHRRFFAISTLVLSLGAMVLGIGLGGEGIA